MRFGIKNNENMKYLAIKYLTNKRIASLLLLLIIGGFSGFHATTSAATAPNIQLTEEKISRILCDVMDWMFTILILLSVIMVLAAAYMYVTAGGNSERVGKATKTITYAAIGVVVALLAKGVPFLVASIVGAGSIAEFCGGGSSGMPRPIRT